MKLTIGCLLTIAGLWFLVGSTTGEHAAGWCLLAFALILLFEGTYFEDLLADEKEKPKPGRERSAEVS